MRTKEINIINFLTPYVACALLLRSGIFCLLNNTGGALNVVNTFGSVENYLHTINKNFIHQHISHLFFVIIFYKK
jgi:hypothetical protein